MLPLRGVFNDAPHINHHHNNDMQTLQKGTLAYFDSFIGLVKVKVLSVDKDGDGTQVSPSPTVKFKVTATLGTYRKGEIAHASSSSVIPRKCIFIRDRQFRVSNQYQVKAS